MKGYDIMKIEYQDYQFIVFSTSYETPLVYINDISKELLNYNKPCVKVIFDMLLNMGNNSERFAEAFFQDNEFARTSFRYIDVNKKSELRKISCSYFKNNLQLLDCSVLSSMQRKMLVRGLAI